MKAFVTTLAAAALILLAGISLGTWATDGAVFTPVTSEPLP